MRCSLPRAHWHARKQRSALIHVALQTRLFVIVRCAQQAGCAAIPPRSREASVRVMAIRALHNSFVDAVFDGHAELGANRLMASIAKFTLLLRQQKFWQSANDGLSDSLCRRHWRRCALSAGYSPSRCPWNGIRGRYRSLAPGSFARRREWLRPLLRRPYGCPLAHGILRNRFFRACLYLKLSICNADSGKNLYKDLCGTRRIVHCR